MADLTLYFDAQHAVDVHDWIIEHSGRTAGVEGPGAAGKVFCSTFRTMTTTPTFDVKLDVI